MQGYQHKGRVIVLIGYLSMQQLFLGNKVIVPETTEREFLANAPAEE
jgi:hypothetical protein